MVAKVHRAARAFWAGFFEALLPGIGHMRNGHARRALWDVLGFLALIGALFLFAGRSFALFASLCLVIVGWRLAHTLWAIAGGWRDPGVAFPWFRSAPFLLAVSLVLGWLLTFSMTGGGLSMRYRLFRLPGEGMQPTISPGDRFVVDMDWYAHHSLQRGDVVAMSNPQDPSELLLKRCVALPGDRVESRGSDVIVNGRVMAFFRNDVALRQPPPETEGAYMGPLTLDQGTFYCLGDDRTNSLDSRILGPIPIKDLRGRALYLVYHDGHAVMGQGL